MLMTKTTLSVLFTVTILLSAAFVTSFSMMESAHAVKAVGSPGHVAAKTYGAKTAGKVCGDKLCRDKGKSVPTEKTETMTVPAPKVESKPTETKPMKESKSKMTDSGKMDSTKMHQWTVVTKTMKSVQDPGVGHESHQLTVILPPSDKIYKGSLTYAASEPVQLVVLHGPLADGQDTGQPIWTPDGKTKFALTFVDPQQASGTWNFAGNALAVHTKNKEPFTVSYTVVASQ